MAVPITLILNLESQALNPGARSGFIRVPVHW